MSAATQETVVLSGHIIDSLILAKVLDTILMMGGTFDLEQVSIGKTRNEPSRARIVVRAGSAKLLTDIRGPSSLMGHPWKGRWTASSRRPLVTVCFRRISMRRPTCPQVRLSGRWIDVDAIEMDLGIVVNKDRTKPPPSRWPA